MEEILKELKNFNIHIIKDNGECQCNDEECFKTVSCWLKKKLIEFERKTWDDCIEKIRNR